MDKNNVPATSDYLSAVEKLTVTKDEFSNLDIKTSLRDAGFYVLQQDVSRNMEEIRNDEELPENVSFYFNGLYCVYTVIPATTNILPTVTTPVNDSQIQNVSSTVGTTCVFSDLKTIPRDFSGRQIEEGDYVAYPVRQGSSMHISHGIVTEIEEKSDSFSPTIKSNVLKVKAFDKDYWNQELRSYNTTVHCLDRVVIVHKNTELGKSFDLTRGAHV